MEELEAEVEAREVRFAFLSLDDHLSEIGVRERTRETFALKAEGGWLMPSNSVRIAALPNAVKGFTGRAMERRALRKTATDGLKSCEGSEFAKGRGRSFSAPAARGHIVPEVMPKLGGLK